jgi:hypothetical protein
MLNLPTDNLYKFVAIFGLIITLFSVYYPFQKYHELYFLSFENESEAKIIEFHRPFIEMRVKHLKQRMEEENSVEKWQSMFDDLYKSQAEINKLITNTLTNSKKGRFLKNELMVYLYVGILCAGLGVFLMFIHR